MTVAIPVPVVTSWRYSPGWMTEASDTNQIVFLVEQKTLMEVDWRCALCAVVSQAGRFSPMAALFFTRCARTTRASRLALEKNRLSRSTNETICLVELSCGEKMICFLRGTGVFLKDRGLELREP